MASGQGSKCPWGAPKNPEPVTSLEDVMSEQLASDLQTKEETKILKKDSDEIPPELLKEIENEGTSDDLLIAQMLQMQFDKEYDQALGMEENQRNGTSKVTVSYQKFRRVPDFPIWDDSDDEDEDLANYLDMDERKRHWDSYETADKDNSNQLPKAGFKKVGNNIVTKHDRELSERNNGKRIMEFPPGIETGDGGGWDMQLSNAVYNELRNFSIKEGKRKNRIGDKIDISTTDQAIDPKTKVLLFKMVNGGILDGINGVISTGKEAVILHADGGPGPEESEDPLNVPKEVAIKVFKTTLNEFKNRDKYIKDDFRFRDRFTKQNPRKIIHMWAEKELHNLMKMLKFGLRVPEAVLLKKHVLVMSFIGREGRPAPKLKDAQLSSAELELAYEDVIRTMKTLYDDCHLVHADLSEYNILWHDKECWYIDVSQAVEPNHPHGLEFLLRDCRNVCDFFSKKSVHDVKSAEELFTDITGLTLEKGATETEVLSQIQDYERNQEILSGVDGAESSKSYPFEYCWEQSQGAHPERTPSKPIPGHSKPRSGRSGKSPKNSINKSPSSSSLSKSPKSPKSPSSLAGLTDEELQKLKESVILTESDNTTVENTSKLTKKPSVVKFEDFPPLS